VPYISFRRGHILVRQMSSASAPRSRVSCQKRGETAVKAITIGTAEGIEDIRLRLSDEFRFLQEEGVKVRIGHTHRGPYDFLNCTVDEAPGTPSEADALVRHYVANALSDIIVEKWEEALIRKIVRGTYRHFTREEQEAIVKYSGRNLAGCGSGDSIQRYKLNRKAQVLHRLRDYLDTADELIMEGFVTFRLRDYVEEVEDAVDRAVDDFLMEREYKEFIRLLKYFVDMQEPRTDHVHVLIRPGGVFRLVDESGSAIRSEYLEEFVAEMAEDDVNYEDLLITALITLAPRRLTVHLRPDEQWEETMETVRGVFDERADFCYGCPVCEAGDDLSDGSCHVRCSH